MHVVYRGREGSIFECSSLKAGCKGWTQGLKWLRENRSGSTGVVGYFSKSLLRTDPITASAAVTASTVTVLYILDSCLDCYNDKSRNLVRARVSNRTLLGVSVLFLREIIVLLLAEGRGEPFSEITK